MYITQIHSPQWVRSGGFLVINGA